jgi:phosphate transport system substrate-binding protein
LLASIAAVGVVLSALVATPAYAETNLRGAGSSFAYKFITACAAASPDYSVSYNPAGSGTGRTAFANGSIAFGASDAASAITSGWSSTRSGYVQANWAYIPVVGGPIGLLYNVPGITSKGLRLDATVIAKILSGKITKWNDPAIKALQTAAVKSKLPAKPIRVVYRSASSGTSENLTNYLRQSVPAIWTKPKNGVIASGNPAGRMPAGAIGAANSQALVTSVKSTPYTFGYADFSDTVDSSGKPKVSVATVKNANGEWIAPSSAASAKFLEYFNSTKYFNKTTGAVTLDHTKAIAGAYNISLLTYAIVDKGASGSTAADVEAFVKYMLNTCGPNRAVTLGYAPITGTLKTKALTMAEAIKA